MHRKTIVATALGALALPAAASAHVTLQPSQAPAGGFTVLNVRVPNEEDKASTKKLALQLPHGFASVSYQAVPGWTAKVKTGKLAKPVKTDDGLVTTEVDVITWTATGAGIGPGQFQDFPLSVQVPGKAGDTLVFKAVQTYSNGDIVRWIEPTPPSGTEPEHPAPVVDVTAAADEHAAAPAATTTPTSSSSSSSGDSNGASKGLAITALIVGALGLVAGGAALFTRRRTASTV
jgi:uncharacterized protein YcnI